MLPAWPPSPADVTAAIWPLAAATTPACGGKARNLAKLIAAGLPVPEGFVIDDSLFRAAVGTIEATDASAITHAALALIAQPPATMIAELVERARSLCEIVVRSSATNEDGEFRAAPGVYDSSAALEPLQVWRGVQFVWTSALGHLAMDYAILDPDDDVLAPATKALTTKLASVAVIVQRYVAGAKVIVYSRRPGKPAGDEVLVQRGDQLVSHRRDAADPLITLALRAEAAIGAERGADVELVEGVDGIVVVQARPIIHPVIGEWVSPPPMVFAPLLELGGTWTWDITHNPDPLSTAQAWLVGAVEAIGVAPYRMQVCAGFLYASPRAELAATISATAAVYDVLAADRAKLDAGIDAIEARLASLLDVTQPLDAGEAARFAPIEATGVPGLDDALARYLAFYEIWAGELSPLVAAVKRAAASVRNAHEPRPSSVEATLLAAARGEIGEAVVLARIGRLSPAWDLAASTYAERPALVRAAIERAKQVAVTPTRSDERNTAADLAERDGHWFAEAQWMMRRAFLTHATERGLDAHDVFWLPVSLLVEGMPAEVAKRRASGARAAAARAAQWAMPVVVPVPRATDTLRDGELIGVGSGGRAQGRVVKFPTLASAVAVGTGDVIVTRAVTPALAVMVVGCAALISETGGLLDHGAAMARELGIPCVVGCAMAWSALENDAIVEVDGNAGRVKLVRSPG